jgi:hypothetical protein
MDVMKLKCLGNTDVGSLITGHIVTGRFKPWVSVGRYVAALALAAHYREST